MSRAPRSPRPVRAALTACAAGLLAAAAVVGCSDDDAPDAGATATPPADATTRPAAVATREPRGDAGDADGRWLELTVVDAVTREPVENVKIKAEDHLQGAAYFTTTEDDGWAEAPVPDAPTGPGRYLSLVVEGEARGYVPVRLTWRDGARDAPWPPPASYTVALDPTTTISGTVVDPRGNPVGGATVVINTYKDLPGPEQLAAMNHKRTTGPDGRWSYGVMPAAYDQVRVTATHPDYARPVYTGRDAPPDDAALRDGSAVLALRDGVAYSGRVLGPGGGPVEGASVAPGDDRVASNVVPPVKTGADGRWKFVAEPGGPMTFTATADGLAPAIAVATPESAGNPIDFDLTEGATLNGRVVDAAGEPVEGARVFVDGWRGARTIQFNATTGPDGRFAWEHAPTGSPVSLDVLARGYRDVREFEATPGDGETTVTLGRPVVIRGTVVDAETGAPVESFSAVPGIFWGERRPIHWERRNAVAGGGGAFEQAFTYPREGHAVRVEAAGYLPADGRVVAGDEGEVELRYELVKAEPLRVELATADGSPAAGARAWLVGPGQQMLFTDESLGELVPNYAEDAVEATAGPDGAMTFPPQPGAFRVFATSEAGYADFEYPEPTDGVAEVMPPDPTTAPAAPTTRPAGPVRLTLTPWARVEGVVKIGPEVAAGEKVVGFFTDRGGYDPQRPRIEFSLTADADGAGRFAFARVPDRPMSVGRLFDTENGYTSTHAEPVDPTPGGTATVTIGGTGRPVVGKIALPPELAGKPWTAVTASLTTRRSLPPLPIAGELAGLAPDAARERVAAFMASDAGRAYRESVNAASFATRSYALALAPDGSYRVEDVPAGDYALSVQFNEPSTPQRGWGETLGQANGAVTVPPAPDAEPRAPFEAPTVEAKAEPKRGDGATAR